MQLELSYILLLFNEIIVCLQNKNESMALLYRNVASIITCFKYGNQLFSKRSQ